MNIYTLINSILTKVIFRYALFKSLMMCYSLLISIIKASEMINAYCTNNMFNIKKIIAIMIRCDD